nr:hypothetical protein [Tanacetum cinerariifolium]
GGLNRPFQRCQQHTTIAVDVGLILFGLVVEERPEAIKSTTANQAVQRALVHALEVDAGAEIEQVLERPFLTRFGDRFHRTFADPLDGAKAVDDAAVVVHGELELRVVHVRKHGRHEGRRVMALQPGSLVRHQPVGGRVRLVEAITSELFYQVENVTGKVGINVVGLAAFNETAALLGHFFGLFLTHRTPQHVGAAEGVAGHDLSNLHHLFLVQDDAVGRRKHRL